jgi:Tape measure protein
MADSKIFTALLKLSAKLDGSFKSSIQKAAQSLEKLDSISKKMGHGATGGLNAMARAADRSFGHMERSASRASHRIGGMFEGLKFGFGFGAGSMLFHGAEEAGGGLFHLIKNAVGAAGQQQLDLTSLTTLLKSNQKAQDAYDWAFKYSAGSHFRMDDVINMQRQMIARGFDMNQVQKVLPQIGDVASGLGIKNPNDLSLGFLEAYSGGNANLRELNMMTMHGVPILKTLEAMLGKDAESVKKMITKRQVSWDMIETGLTKLTGPGGLFNKATANTASTYQGRLSTVQDYGLGVERAFGRPMMAEITKILGKLIDGGTLGKLYDWTEAFSSGPMQSAFEKMNQAFQQAADAGKFKELWAVVSDIGNKIGGKLSRMFGGNFAFFNALDRLIGGLKWIDSHGSQIAAVAQRIMGSFIALQAFKLTTGIIGGFETLLSVCNPLGLSLIAIAVAGALIAANWSTIGPAIQPAIDAMGKFAGGKWDEFVQKTGPKWAAILDDIQRIWGNLLQITQRLQPVIDLANTAIGRMASFDFQALIGAVGVLQKAFDGVAAVTRGIEGTLDVISGHPLSPGSMDELKKNADYLKSHQGHVWDNPGTFPAKPTDSTGKPTSSTGDGAQNKNTVFNNTFHVQGHDTNDLARKIQDVMNKQLRSSYA